MEIIEGPPVGKARPRVTRRVTYTPAKTSHYEDLVTITLIADAKQLDLNTLNKISLNSLTVDFTSVQTELLPEPKKVEDK